MPNPGFASLLAVHLATRALADDALEDRRTTVLRALIRVAAINPTALDIVLSYLRIAAEPDDDLLNDIAAEVGGVRLSDVAAPATQIGPDATMPG